MPPEAKRKKWDPVMMVRAVKAVRQNEMGYKKAAKYFGVPKGTLERYVKDSGKTAESLVEVPLGRKPALPQDIENLLVKYCVDMDSRFYGLRKKDIRTMAFRLAIKNGLKHPFSTEKQCAGMKWLRLFLKRHPTLTLRKPQATSFARIRGFSPENVQTFFEIYEPELKKIKSQAHRLYNVDETGITIVQHKSAKVISLKGKKNVGTLTSAERGHLITAVTCMNAAGSYVPPLIVWPRKNMQDALMQGTPAGSIFACHPSGWIQTDIFTMWFNHFLKHVKPSESDPALLVLDGHNSHTRNIDIIDRARENHVTIVCLPPHSSHKMQPLDVSFMFPLKTFYAQSIEDWLHSNPGKVVTNFQVGQLFGIAYNRAATMNNSINGFKKTGLFPLNKNAFGEEDFPIHSHRVDSSTVNEGPITPSTTKPRCSTANVEEGQPSSSNQFLVTPEEINPLPMLPGSDPLNLSRPRARKACIITSTPHKKEVTESKDKKEKQNLRKSLFPTKGNKLMKDSKSSKDKTERKLGEGKEKEKLKGKGKGVPTGKGKLKKKRNESDDDCSSVDGEENISLHDSSDDNDDDNDAECLFCGCLYSQDKGGEQWRQCRRCCMWAHEDCGADEQFICKVCENIERKQK